MLTTKEVVKMEDSKQARKQASKKEVIQEIQSMLPKTCRKAIKKQESYQANCKIACTWKASKQAICKNTCKTNHGKASKQFT